MDPFARRLRPLRVGVSARYQVTAWRIVSRIFTNEDRSRGRVPAPIRRRRSGKIGELIARSERPADHADVGGRRPHRWTRSCDADVATSAGARVHGCAGRTVSLAYDDRRGGWRQVLARPRPELRFYRQSRRRRVLLTTTTSFTQLPQIFAGLGAQTPH